MGRGDTTATVVTGNGDRAAAATVGVTVIHEASRGAPAGHGAAVTDIATRIVAVIPIVLATRMM